MSNLEFIVDRHVIDEKGKAMLMTLLDQFDALRSKSPKCLFDIELSISIGPGNELHSVNNKTICKDCWLVLRYNCAAVCISGKKCKTEPGVTTFYIRTATKADTYVYKKINLIEILNKNTKPFIRYIDNRKIQKLIDTSNKARSTAQYQIIKKSSNTEMIGGVITDAISATINAQIPEINKLFNTNDISQEFVNNVKSLTDLYKSDKFVIVGGADSVTTSGSNVTVATDASVVKQDWNKFISDMKNTYNKVADGTKDVYNKVVDTSKKTGDKFNNLATDLTNMFNPQLKSVSDNLAIVVDK